MLRFLASKLGRKKPLAETQRQSMERLISELNEAIDLLSEKPSVTIHPLNGHVGLKLPKHFPDEALALPKPPQNADAELSEPKTDLVEAATEPVAKAKDAA